MLALQRLNPGAFINRNINLLKVGYRLQIPDLREIRSFSNGAALSEVKRQNLAFQDYKAGRLTQLDGRRTSTAGSSLPSAREDGELRLVAPPLTQRSEADGDSAAASASLAYELAGVKEELDQARRSNAELNAQAGELSRQLETLSEIISLKDEQLAALRGQLRRARDDESLLETMKAMYEQAMEDLEDMYEQAMEDLEDIEDLDDLTRVSGPLLWAMIAAVLVAITLVVLLLRSGSTRSGREEGYSSLPAGWEDDELSESYTVSPHEGDELSQSYAVSQQEGENKRHDEQQAPQLSQLPDPAADPSPGTDMPSISARQDAMDGDNSGKLELAKAYMEMGDSTGARALLNQVLAEGNPADTAEASELLGKLG